MVKLPYRATFNQEECTLVSIVLLRVYSMTQTTSRRLEVSRPSVQSIHVSMLMRLDISALFDYHPQIQPAVSTTPTKHRGIDHVAPRLSNV